MNREHNYFFRVPNNHDIRCVSSFVELMENMEASEHLPIVYRGHDDISYKLLPFLFRNLGYRQSEGEMMRMIFASQPEAFNNDVSTLDRLVRVQHFGLPTRLMDVTWNPLVALYFCCKAQLDKDGEVVAIAWDPAKTKFFDSDTVSVLANLAYLNGGERNSLKHQLSRDVEGFNSIPAAERLVAFIKAEKPYFKNIIRPADLVKPLLVRPKQTNERITAQNGAFIMFGINNELIETGEDDVFIRVGIRVPSDAKARILKQLERLGFNDQTMYPELESAARYVRTQFFRS